MARLAVAVGGYGVQPEVLEVVGALAVVAAEAVGALRVGKRAVGGEEGMAGGAVESRHRPVAGRVALHTLEAETGEVDLMAGRVRDLLPARIAGEVARTAAHEVDFRVPGDLRGPERDVLVEPLEALAGRLGVAGVAPDRAVHAGPPLRERALHQMAGLAEARVVLDVVVSSQSYRRGDPGQRQRNHCHHAASHRAPSL